MQLDVGRIGLEQFKMIFENTVTRLGKFVDLDWIELWWAAKRPG